MKKLAMLVVLILAGCIQGPAGKDGQDGEDAIIWVRSGILSSSTREQWNTTGTPKYSWDINFDKISASKFVQIRVRQGSGFAWLEPTNEVSPGALISLGEGWIRIMEGSDGTSLTGYEYRIVVME